MLHFLARIVKINAVLVDELDVDRTVTVVKTLYQILQLR
jgi:hypothetical protein